MIDEYSHVDLKYFAMNEFLSDLVIVYENEKYYCHRIILCAFSSYIYSKFKEEVNLVQEGKVMLNLPQRVRTYCEDTPDDKIIPHILRYCYSNGDFVPLRNDLNCRNVASFLSVAHCLGMRRLLNQIEDYIIESFHLTEYKDNTPLILLESSKFNLPKVTEEAYLVIWRNFDTIVDLDKHIVNFPYDLFYHLIQSDEIEAQGEKKICDLILRYIRFRAEIIKDDNREEIINQLDHLDKEWLNYVCEVNSKFAIKALSIEEERSLIESIRFSFLSHLDILEASRDPIMSRHQELILNALSTRLDNYENISDKTNYAKLNTKPRKYLTSGHQFVINDNVSDMKLSQSLSLKDAKPSEGIIYSNNYPSNPIPPQSETKIINQGYKGNNWNEFKYSYPYDLNGLFYFLGTQGYHLIYKNPHETGQVFVFASSVGKGNPSDIVGRDLVNFRTLNEENAFIGIDLKEGRSFIPTCYTIRNRNSSKYVMLNWTLEGSNDGVSFQILDRRVYSPKQEVKNNENIFNSLLVPGQITTYTVDPVIKYRYPYGFRYIYLRQSERNSSGSYNLAISGMELYGYFRGEINIKK